MLSDVFGAKTKAVIAMTHIGALPGSPLYDPRGGMARLVGDVARDIGHLQAGAADAIMFGNENDRPYGFKAPPEGIAAMTAVIEAVTGASFVREIFTGLFAGDMGPWQPDCAALAPARHARPARDEAPVQHQRRVRGLPRHKADRAQGAQRRVLVARRRDVNGLR